MIIQSKNGTGKTLAFSMLAAYNLRALPVPSGVIDETQVIPIKALILAPTREIALQISEFFTFLAKLNPVLLIGGLDGKD